MKTLKYIALAALTLSFAACEKDNDFQGVSDPDAVKINATIGNMQTRVAYSSEYGSTMFTSGDAIKVVNTMRTSKNEATYTTTNGTTWTTTHAFVWNSSSKNKFQAYYPAADYSSFENFTIPANQGTNKELGLADWMTVETEEISKPDNGVLKLEFQHRLAKVTVKITKWNSEYADADKLVSEPSIYSKGLELKAEYGDNVEITASDNGGVISAATTETYEYTAIVMPAAYTSTDNIFTFKVDGKFLTVPVRNNSTLTGGLEAGKHYTFSLKVGKEAVSISSVSVANWNKEEINGGVAEEVPYYYNAATNTYNIYLSEGVQAAIDEAELTGTAENPATVKLMADVEVAGEPNEYGEVDQDILVDAGVIVLDLNGHTLTGKTGWATIQIDNGAKLTIGDSSESKSGKIQNLLNDAIYVYNGSTLEVNNGTFEGNVYGIYGQDESTSITINGGAFKFGKTAIYPQNSSLTITGGTFEGSKYALHFNNATKALITGGSFVGGEYDINTQKAIGFLSFNEETGEGPTFPGGFGIYNNNSTSFTLKPLLAEGAGYYVNDELLDLADDATSCEGDVTVKRIPTNE